MFGSGLLYIIFSSGILTNIYFQHKILKYLTGFEFVGLTDHFPPFGTNLI